MTDPASPIPAATLVVLREAAGALELLMVERAKAMAFAGGALVFPGGRVDAGDVALAASLGRDGEEGAARIAAIRETVEEAGLGVGLSPLPSPEGLDQLRNALHGGTPFAEALAAIGTALDLDALTPFARWRPDHAPVRIFDTRFYLAVLPAGSPAATVDATENVRLFWSTAAAVLEEADAGLVTLIYPTRRNLERLAQFATVAQALADAAAYPVRTVTPFVDVRDGVRHLCIPGDLGYPVISEPLASVQRG